MPTIVNGILTEELVSEHSEGIGAEGPFATKGYLCSWSNRFTLANGFLGLSSYSGGTASIIPPTTYPESSNLYVQGVTIQGVGQPFQGTKQLAWPYAIVRVSYGVPRYGVLAADDPGGHNSIDPTMPLVYATQELDFATEWITIPRAAVTAGGNAVNKDVNVRIPRCDMTVTLTRMPFLPGTLIFSTLSAPINNAKFLNCDAGHCVYNGGKVRRSASTDGSFTQDVSHSFSYRAIAPWDYEFDPTGMGGWLVLRDRAGNPVVSRGDLSVLFTYPYKYT